jgi:ABC-type Mn2+/Zn2+ transport system permease subunit
VFGYLVIPAVAGVMVSSRTGVALAVGWAFGVAGSLIGIAGSVQWDLPAAPSILVALTLLLAAAGGARWMWRVAGGKAG